jgi:hypothetical protein
MGRERLRLDSAAAQTPAAAHHVEGILGGIEKDATQTVRDRWQCLDGAERAHEGRP